MGARLERALRSLGLTAAQHNALQHVAAEIARRTGFTPQSMGAAVNALVDRGLLARHDHPTNRKTVQLTITDSGANLTEQRDVVERLDMEALAVSPPLSGKSYAPSRSGCSPSSILTLCRRQACVERAECAVPAPGRGSGRTCAHPRCSTSGVSSVIWRSRSLMRRRSVRLMRLRG
ncbi:MarR family winged helix-turn-helix transcriptional regulator [Streptomyces sp. NPDC087903]|uniref:MarR family winged helix-turn-helix transcriptional regulator n=1 Tax=Streptomyces sp. NPDC087903 TaxID=3365819 RepID=UPI0038073E7F